MVDLDEVPPDCVEEGAADETGHSRAIRYRLRRRVRISLLQHVLVVLTDVCWLRLELLVQSSDWNKFDLEGIHSRPRLHELEVLCRGSGLRSETREQELSDVDVVVSSWVRGQGH